MTQRCKKEEQYYDVSKKYIVFGTMTLTEGVTDPATAKRVFDAMMTMKKIDIAAIEAARRGE